MKLLTKADLINRLDKELPDDSVIALVSLTAWEVLDTNEPLIPDRRDEFEGLLPERVTHLFNIG